MTNVVANDRLSQIVTKCEKVMSYVYQRTLNEPISVSGIGLHSGKEVILTLKPAPADTGIVFVRTDLDGAIVPMDAHLVQDTVMSSNLVVGDARVGTVEHLLSAVAAMGIDNLTIEVSAPEIPIMDGSAAPFLYLMVEAGICEQASPKRFLKITKPVMVQDGDKWAKISPDDGGFLMSFEIDFDHQAIKATPQTFSLDFSSQSFASEVARARTFGFLKDLEYLQKHNLALGGSLDNAIVLDDEKVVNEGGLHFPDEFVRHKMLDAVGDLYVIGYPLLGKFEAYKSGHALNNKLIRAILADESCHEIVTIYDKNACPIRYYPAQKELNSDDLPKFAEVPQLYAWNI